MTDFHKIELFVLKCAVIEKGLRTSLAERQTDIEPIEDETATDRLEVYILQFDLQNRTNAARMARYYQIFYMLENDIRRLIVETLETAHGPDWWDKCVSQAIKDEVKKNRGREEQAAISLRSESEIDYITFGQLGDLIRDNWADFAGMMRGQSAVGRVLTALNMLRGTIAHCGVLAEDEVDRLKLTIRDWFRVLEGPRS